MSSQTTTAAQSGQRAAGIDPRGVRFTAALTTVILALALLLRSPWLLGLQAVVFAIGLVYFYFIMNYYVGKPLDLQTLFVTGFLVFAPADVAYCILSGFLAKRLQPVLQKSFAAA